MDRLQTYAEWRAGARRRRVYATLGGVAIGAIMTALACLASLMLNGCGDEEDVVVLPEPVGGAVQAVVRHWTAGSFTPMLGKLPGLPTIAFTEFPDRCQVIHEAKHGEQQERDGGAPWLLRYARELWACLREHAPTRWREYLEACYRGVSYEADAYLTEAACRAGAL